MESLGEEVHRLHAVDAVAPVCEHGLEVARQGRGVAAHIGDTAGAGVEQGPERLRLSLSQQGADSAGTDGSLPDLQPLQLLLRRVLLQASSELNNAEESAESAVAVAPAAKEESKDEE